jgi:hypothetical protein
MLFRNLNDYKDWVDQYSQFFIDGIMLEIHPEKLLEVSEWKCQKAKEFGYPVFCFIFGYNWKVVREKFLGIPYQMDADFRNLNDSVSLGEHLEPLVDHVIILNPDMIDASKVSVNESYLNNISDASKRELMRGCYNITYLFRQVIPNHRVNKRLFFAMDGPMYLVGANATEGEFASNRQILIVTDVMRDSYELVRSGINKIILDMITEHVPSLLNEIPNLHNEALKITRGEQPELSGFQLDLGHTFAYEGYPLSDGAKLWQIFFQIKNWPFGSAYLKDIIYVEKSE